MSIENESEDLQEVVQVYIIKDRVIRGTKHLKKWLPVKDVERLVTEEKEHKGSGVDLDLTSSVGKPLILTYQEGEVQDKDSITIEHFLVETPGNNN